ncbi:DUF4960 domain-containing protein [Flavobacterium sp. HBTb2-11-1]|uniref:DUF4960 domain-containing protein n=1 Tax=Flavobacterium sp. HBTb2-11-1 TaxID=2692212 RepID=UPI001367BDE5|nr:DUF4960 domain-containing protein [Flavobacterium sp. HBTb2-11-1]MXO04434.1 DUF4960 domain-containing protein [Flavobacterium sp. HBTb2-11-1]
MKNYNKRTFFYQVVLFGFLSLLIISCDARDNYNDDADSKLSILESVSINGVPGSIDNLSGVISVVLPNTTNLESVLLETTTPSGVISSPASGTTINLKSNRAVSVSFSNSKRNYVIDYKILPSRIAFINEAAAIGDIADDDTKAFAQWAKDTYKEDFVYIPFNDLTIGSLAEVNVLLFYYDQVGSSALPAAILNKKNVITQFVAEGGKMLTGGMANSYIGEIGRDKSGLLTIRSNGAGGNNNDIWSIDAGVNFQNDQRNSPVFNITTVISTDSNGYFPVINGGFKEDHNTMWDLGPLLAAGHQLGQFGEFQRLYGGKVLATWSGVSDEAVAGIIEFMPTPVFAGTIIGIGFGGMEWSMNDNRINPYANNVKGIYRNSIDYLRTK